MHLVARLAAHRTLAAAPREQLAWVVMHGRERLLSVGQVASPETGRLEEMWVVLSGHLSIRVNRGAGPRKVMEWRGGDVTGLLPYSRLGSPPGKLTAEEPTEILAVEAKHFPVMIRECHELTRILVHVMLDRARRFTSSDLLDEKMLSLGRLAAGLAHELNNPASAVARSAAGLSSRLGQVERTSRAIGGARLSRSQLALLERALEACRSAGATSIQSPIEQADRQDLLADWLAAHGANERLTDTLAETPMTLEELDALASGLDFDTLDLVIQALSAACTTRKLAREIEAAASRIHALVSAVKGFTYMDQSAAPKPVDIGQGLSDTLAVLAAKARAKSLGVTIDIEPGLPLVQGVGGELNQVWANLIDNALDAAPSSGHVHVSAAREGRYVVVRIVDDGPGIPLEARDRIFEPFFTTKRVGQGTGLGLDIARRLVNQHDGEIDVLSQPGRTELRVTLAAANVPDHHGQSTWRSQLSLP
ncbi:MAG: ATP-binding protein [Vicinamibacteraceae bacterium]